MVHAHHHAGRVLWCAPGHRSRISPIIYSKNYLVVSLERNLYYLINIHNRIRLIILNILLKFIKNAIFKI